MGYHIILKHSKNKIEHHYVEKINEMANYALDENTIVYQGESHWKPMLIKENMNYHNFIYDWHRAGIKAQEIFKEQALKKEFILEELSQDIETFKAYIDIKDDYLNIKRGDFLIRNVQNIEVDVKCRTFYTPKSLDYNCFDFKVDHLVRHLNMIKLTKTPIIIAIYQREPNTDNPIKNSLRMIEIEHIDKIVKEYKLKKVKKTNSKKENYWVYQIPVKNTMKKFDLISHLKNRNLK